MDTNETKKSQNRLKKEQIVAKLVEKFDAANGVVFADFQGLTHQQLENLKKELKKNDATIVVAKNSLIRISMGESKKFADYKENEGLNLPTATLFIRGDMVEPLKHLQKLVKEAGLPKIKFGIVDGALVDESGVLKIASLPTRDTLIAQFVGTLNSPIQGLVVTLNGTIQKFVMTLDAVAKSKPAVAPTAPAAEPTTSPAETSASETPVTDASEQTETSSENEASSGTTAAASASADETAEVPNETPTEEKPETDDEGGEK
jgi:large subunit ribosomal protein L10